MMLIILEEEIKRLLSYKIYQQIIDSISQTGRKVRPHIQGRGACPMRRIFSKLTCDFITELAITRLSYVIDD
jgi:hypothetical protein